MRLIGLTGKARAGKDTVADYILEAVPGRKESFARALKVSAAALFGVPENDAVEWCERFKHEGTVLVELSVDLDCSMSGRQFLQRYGTEAHRDVFGSEFWVDHLLGRIAAEAIRDTTPTTVVITDARFENECKAIRRMGGEIWEVVRPDNPDALTGALESTHASESGVSADVIDRIINNGGTLHDLQLGVWKSLANPKERQA